ncbi:MAG: phage shock protein A [Candidatus Anammoximicrobium sp.]|nr:phage shock protein A [Candidatus Anammoximicrobium sp.]
MGLFKRISDIISANFNDMVEGYEDPEKMLRQAIREMEDAIATAKPDVVRAMASEKNVAKELASNEAQVTVWTDRAETAVKAGDDDLARKAITRKREYEKIAAALRDQHEAAVEASQTLRRQLEAMQAKLKDAQRRLGTLTARQKAAQVRAKAAQSQAGLTPELKQDAFDKFDRLARKVEMAEAEAEAFSELARNERQAEDVADDIESSGEFSDTEAELLELKKKLKRKK